MIITLSSMNYQVTVNTLGAELKSFRNPIGTEYIWNSDPAHWMRSSPLLFPTIGNVRNGKTVIEGKEYEMPKHGFCKDSEFTVLSQSGDTVTFSLSTNENTRQNYPYDFELRLTYRLCRNRLSMTYQVYNKDTRTMYYHIGAHPGFMCPLAEGEAFTDYVLSFEKEERLEATVYDLTNLCFSSTQKKLFAEKGTVLPLTVEMFDNDAVLFPHTDSRMVQLLNPATGNGMEMRYTGFHSIAFWTPAGGTAPFLCLEPWNGAAIYDNDSDIFSEKRDILSLDAGGEAEYQLEITLLGSTAL